MSAIPCTWCIVAEAQRSTIDAGTISTPHWLAHAYLFQSFQNRLVLRNFYREALVIDSTW
ncbi:MAG: hypothetical protein JOZ78_20995 [Chroococcidiopsidaceae cyanobacterium CP_BM_ER_R8_30]|nr:hypothetical protein [Chroococcidiopsidaceae cyanobacterium CP_BM_ER_R8_30]